MALADVIAATQRFLTRRATAYRFTFNPADQMDRIVMADLARFCRALESTAHENPHVAARLDGRREVWIRIQQHINLPTDELYRIYGGPQKNPPG